MSSEGTDGRWVTESVATGSFGGASLPAVHEALQDSGGPELVQLSDHTDPHVPVPPQQPAHVFAVTCDGKNKVIDLTRLLYGDRPAGGAVV